MILNFFLNFLLLLAVPATQVPPPPAANSYESLVDNIKEVLKIEFKEDTYKNLKFTKPSTTKTFSDLTQLEKDVFVLQRAKAFSQHIRVVEQKMVDELLLLSNDDSENGLATKEKMAKMIAEVPTMKKEQTKISIDFVQQMVQRNKLNQAEADKLLKEIHRINDSVYSNAP